jgi:hypothetical protein
MKEQRGIRKQERGGGSDSILLAPLSYFLSP